MGEHACTDTTMEANMSYLRTRFERRIDERTAADIGDALRAGSVQAAAMAMDHLQVDVDVALRVLAGKNDDRGKKRRNTSPGPSTAG
jgi:hypothetical protein